jgi:transcriptional regulator with XRE-family HTH domain
VSKGVTQRQRIGPQIRHLRQLRGLTLDDLAGTAGLSASHLSRLERSQTLPSFTVLANIAQVLDVSIDEFVQLEHDLQELDEQLAWQADLLALDSNAYQEILGLSIDTRRQLNHAIELLSNGMMSEINVQEEVSRLFDGPKSLPQVHSRLRKLIESRGQNAVGLSRSLVQILEIPGSRVGTITDAGLLATAPNIDYTMIYRGLFPGLPLDPSVARRWRRWYSLAADEFPFDWPIRLIASEDLFEKVEERFSEIHVVDGKLVTSNVARYWLKMLQTGDQFELAVTTDDIGGENVLVAGRAAALFEQYPEGDALHERPTGLWVSSSHLVEPIIKTLDKTWDSLSKADKDRSKAENWLERHAS